ncbi:MAG TPA: DUF3237 family protein [Actinomycetaceae bacterium]|nr:DUF3237 family protein [Actinomycetaceae bacterium]
MATQKFTTTPHVRPFSTATIEVGEPIAIEQPDGLKRVIPINGGTVTGDGWHGVVLPGGADHQTIRVPEAMDLHAISMMQVEDGPIIRVENHAIRAGDPDVIERLNRGEEVDPELIYFRGAARLSTGPDNEFSWINSRLFLATGERHPRSVTVNLFVVE